MRSQAQPVWAEAHGPVRSLAGISRTKFQLPLQNSGDSVHGTSALTVGTGRRIGLACRSVIWVEFSTLRQSQESPLLTPMWLTHFEFFTTSDSALLLLGRIIMFSANIY